MHDSYFILIVTIIISIIILFGNNCTNDNNCYDNERGKNSCLFAICLPNSPGHFCHQCNLITNFVLFDASVCENLKLSTFVLVCNGRRVFYM